MLASAASKHARKADGSDAGVATEDQWHLAASVPTYKSLLSALAPLDVVQKDYLAICTLLAGHPSPAGLIFLTDSKMKKFPHDSIFPRITQSPTETRERLHRHSELVWCMTDERPAPKVFSLVGKSADNVRALASWAEDAILEHLPPLVRSREDKWWPAA